MIDQSLAAGLALEGFEHWSAGRLEESCDCYVKAINVADPTHWALQDYYGQFACVLDELGKAEEACAQYEKAVEAALAQGEGHASKSVLIARYFLADHLIRNHTPDRAIRALVPALSSAPNHWLICLAYAEALFALGQIAESRAAAERAIANAPTPQKSDELAVHLSNILGAAGLSLG